MRRMVELDEAQVAELERLAAAEHRSVAELVRQAVAAYLSQRPADHSAAAERLDAVVASFRAGILPDVTPEEIEAEITAARAEYRAERTRMRGLDGPDAGRH